MKTLMVEGVLLQYPDHNLPYQINIVAFDYQLCSAILQQEIHVSYYTCKLSLAQENYTTSEKDCFQ